MNETTTTLPKGWHNHDGYRQIFCAALTGFIANPDFGGPLHQGAPWTAVAFAYEVVREAKGLVDHEASARDRDGTRSAETACPAPVPQDCQARAAESGIAQPEEP